MKKPKSGIAFHCHHDVLAEYVYDYEERVEFIKDSKPETERKLRLKLFKLIPQDRLPQKAWDAYGKAWDACGKAWDAYDKARGAYDKARDACGKTNHKALEKLHKELCPDCPWDGHTIFN
ncbi:hypothetical protein LCGC14_1016050 [marine sediment metagenome]|uniref:Uncharacterized protein n=1 Tax=marine sediment metagenome TaxID=412755 RepID=A0A0F9QH06_9ZZZZ